MKTCVLWNRIAIGSILFLALAGCTTSAPETPVSEPAHPPTDVPTTAPADCTTSAPETPVSEPAHPPTDVPTTAPEPTVTPLSFIEGTEFPTGRFVNGRGTRAFEFGEDGTWHYFEGNMDKPAVSGYYATTGNLYTEMTHDYNYPGYPSIPVTYYWAYDGQSLTFQLYGEDVMSHRRSCYDGQTYIKVE
jgi:hypothetical protein